MRILKDGGDGCSGAEDLDMQNSSSVVSSLATDSEDFFDELFDDVLQCLQPKKKRIRNRRRGPFKVPRVDVRRQYVAMFTNMMNTQDSDFTRKFFDTFCTPDVQMSMHCSDMFALSKSDEAAIDVTRLHVQSPPTVSKFFTLLQRFSPDLVITMDNVELVTYCRGEEVTVRALMGINETLLHRTPLPMLAHHYLLQSSSVNEEKQSGRKRKYEPDDLPLLPAAETIPGRVQMQLVVQLQFKVDKEKRITAMDFSFPIHSSFSQSIGGSLL